MDARFVELGRALMASKEAPGRLVQTAWSLLSGTRAGRLAFSRMIGRFVPYTGTIRPVVDELGNGCCVVHVDDAPDLRNHLGSVHAAVLFNLVEMTANLAVSSVMPLDARFIVSSMRIDYLHKARGRIVASCTAPTITSAERREHEILVELHDPTGKLVSRGFVTTLVGPARPQSSRPA